MRENPTLAEARRIARQPINDRLDGKQGEEARSVILHLMEMAGLDYGDAINLLSAPQWFDWHEGWTVGYASGIRKNTTKEN